MKRNVLRFENVFLRTRNKNTHLEESHVELISGVSGEVVSGRLSVIMGGSGSSKTSFLNLLVGKIDKTAMTSGTITFNRRLRNPYKWLNRISYLEQFDVFMPNITVEEAIRYALVFRKGESRKIDDVSERVDAIIGDLELTKIRGSLLSSISGGERKRAMLAVELVTEPDVIFLDEPTTGLDSHLALDTIKMLKKYAVEKNKIVLMTVHQPGDGMFSLFDDVIILNRGCVFYSGPASAIHELLRAHGMEQHPGLSISEHLFSLYAKSADSQQSPPDSPGPGDFERESELCIISSISWRHVRELLCRQLTADYRGRTTRNILLFKIALLTLLFFFLCDKIRYTVFSLIKESCPTYTRAATEYVDDLRVFLARNYASLGIANDEILDFFAYSMAPFITCFSIFSDSTFLDQQRFLRKESFTCSYSQFSLFASIMIYECGFSLARTLYFCLILSLTQLRAVLTFRAFVIFTLMPLSMVAFMNLAKILSSGIYPLNIARVAAFVFTTFLRPLWLSMELRELGKRYSFMRYLYPASYLFFLCPFTLLDSLFYVTLGGRNAISPGFILFIAKAGGISIDPGIPAQYMLNYNITFLNRHVLSSELHAILAFFSLASVLVLSVVLLTTKLSPSVRLILSSKSLEKRLDEVTIKS